MHTTAHGLYMAGTKANQRKRNTKIFTTFYINIQAQKKDTKTKTEFGKSKKEKHKDFHNFLC